MLRDARKMIQAAIVQTTVCIIGAGMAGITIALEFKRNGIKTCLLESGGMAPDKLTRDLSNGENDGLPYTFADGSRSRFIGGSSNCWGGWCAPMIDNDFQKRDWINHSGWPISFSDLAPYYKRSHEVLQLGPYDYTSAYWEKAIGRSDVRSAQLNPAIVTDGISQFSPPGRMVNVFNSELKDAEDITTFLYANVTNIETDETGKNITGVEVKTMAGNSFRIHAKIFILATGGIENARMLLASNQVHQNGIGNENDLVGRYFMDHPRMLAGSLKLSKTWSNNRLYDIRYHYHDKAVKAHDTNIGCQLVLTPEVLRKERLLSSRICLYSVFRGENSKGVLAAHRLKDAIVKKRIEGLHFKKDMASIITHPFDIGVYGISSKFKWRSMIQEVKFQIIMEQEPNPASRVALSRDKDAFGMNRVKVTWLIGETEHRTFKRSLEIVGEEFKAKGIAESVSLDTPEGYNWPDGLTGTWHHMGTTRMDDSPRQGVVNRDCRVFSTNNLYIAGSSVFPTVGSNFPSMTLTALALRLSDHIKSRLEKDSEAVVISNDDDASTVG